MVYANLRRIEFWILLVAGLAWLDAGAGESVLALVLAAIPGGCMLTAALGFLLFPGERGLSRTGGLGALVGLLFGLPVLLASPWLGLGLLLASAAGMVAAGLLGLDDTPQPEGMAPPERSLRLGAETGFDEAVLGLLGLNMGVFGSGGQAEAARETGEALEWLEERGWLESPRNYHRPPPELEADDVGIRDERSAGLRFEVMRFESGYEPWPESPGRGRYLGYERCRNGVAWLLRGDPEAPWLINIHGLGMGIPWLDMKLLQARTLHQELGLNLVFPVLPLHGPRRRSLVSGRGFITGNAMDTLHAETQAAWDLRRVLSWVVGQGATRVGVHGVSLGGYNAALLACLADGLDRVIAGIPVDDLAELLWWHGSAASLAAAESEALSAERLARLFTVISPLAMDCKVPGDSRYIYAGLADRLVPPTFVERLWEHWGQPAIHWYRGGHLTALAHPAAIAFLEDAAAGLKRPQ